MHDVRKRETARVPDTINDLVVVRRFTVVLFASALERHVLPRGTTDADAASLARDFWDVELEGRAPQTRDDVDDLVDALIDTFPHLQDTRSNAVPTLIPVRRLLGEFMSDTDADTAIARHHRAAPRTDTRTRPDVSRSARARVPLGWRIYWVLAIALVAILIVVAVHSGRVENIVLTSILMPGVALIVAGCTAAIAPRRR